MGKVVKFELKAAPKFAFKKVKSRKISSTENSNQLNLFNSKHEGKVLKLPYNLAIFDEALLFDEQGKDKAEELYWEAILNGESVPDAYCNLGILQFNAGNKAKAIDCFTQSLKAEPRHFESHYNLANLYLEVENIALARLHYEVAAEIEPGFPNVFYNLGVVYAMTRDFEKAAAGLERYTSMVTDEESLEARGLLLSIRESLSLGKS